MSMNKKTRSLYGTREEAQRIYYQRQRIKTQQNIIDKLQQENSQLKEKIEYLKSKIENKDKWCQLIADIGYDYDGFRKVESLMSLIDELVKYALYSRDDYDYEEILKGDKE